MLVAGEVVLVVEWVRLLLHVYRMRWEGEAALRQGQRCGLRDGGGLV